ncbi:NADP(H)-dependent aldo-keto reductase [Sansalvadorimonas sp. 2012CJ34-2]|uniref:NADP(H)-dependent aldo-keto reductase n=1 Tax=Parendozoicomonas callyspongiae TaxID=2942213 RepID=A0ABT0PEM9_9GAMM|nr:NADP(H)-dependent aldo-keto reductase [Sansalvadorimonas sp. 2012CJ34-2]MCL6268993.1 NADP(H)-dependent aldo-keto reductase [Sansalvadorimonas sp. 2012CJ34-2]
MEYRNLGRTDTRVSLICLGTMTWGEQNTEEEAFAQLDYATERGINFLDTAEMYPVPPKEETYTRTESIIGNWLKQRGQRDDIVIATKVCGPGFSYMDGGRHFNRHHIERALEGSLKRLGTDYIDLYQLHWPDRNTNNFGQRGFVYQDNEQSTPIEETLEVLDSLVKAGKIRHIGLSNESPWGAMQFLYHAEKKGWPRVVSIQNPYNLLNRLFEIGLAEIAHREDLGLLAYSPLAMGTLSGKYLNGARPEGSRMALFTRFQRYNNQEAESAIQAYVKLAQDHDLDPAQMALAYINSRSFLTSNIIGATSLEQLTADIDSFELNLAPDVLSEIEKIHSRHPNPSP